MLQVHIKSFHIPPQVTENELKCVAACDKYVHWVIFELIFIDFSFLDFTVKTCKFIPHLLAEIFFSPTSFFPLHPHWEKSSGASCSLSVLTCFPGTEELGGLSGGA